jgi:hypothetical protein
MGDRVSAISGSSQVEYGWVEYAFRRTGKRIIESNRL